MHLRVGDRSFPVACSSWSFACLPLEAAIRIVRLLGFGHIDIGFGHLPREGLASPRSQGRLLRKRLSREGLKASDIFPLLPFETNDLDVRHREENTRTVRAVLELAEGCGAPGVTLKPGIAQPAAQDGGWRASLDALMEYVALARMAGVGLSVEPYVDSIVEDPRAALRLVESVPGLELTLDYSHFVSLGYEIGDLRHLQSYARHVHVRQASRGRLQASARNGVIPLLRILEELAARGYGGAVSLEYQNSDWHGMNDIDVITETVATLRQLGLRK